tara:strand:+ start:884 stop:1402 length:519 start_codon:yes stop_codon:yes gene_type:complete
MEKNMIAVVDGVFTNLQMEFWKKNINRSTGNFVSGVLDKEGEGWHLADCEHDNSEMCNQILRHAGKYFDISKMVGYDYWTHTNTRPMQWHYDKDEIAYTTKGVTRYPICSTVFYLEVENLSNGKLQFKNGVEVTPRENRLVLFSPGLYHGVEQFKGLRTGINVNPWKTPLYK